MQVYILTYTDFVLGVFSTIDKLTQYRDKHCKRMNNNKNHYGVWIKEVDSLCQTSNEETS